MTDDIRRVRFGTFELDLRSGDLWRNGQRRTLQEQPFIILKVLLDHPLDVVRRDELFRALWPDQAHGEFEHGLNAAVKRLRDTLGDDLEAACLIETVPKRGYRFTVASEPVAPVTLPALPEREPELKAEPGLASEPTADPLQKRGWLSMVRLIPMSVLVMLAVGGTVLYVWAHGGTASTEAGSDTPHSPPSHIDPSHRVLTQVTFDDGWTTDPAVSPDGHYLAYASDRGGAGSSSIWIQRLAGGTPLQLTHGSTNDREPAFSPDGSRIVFRSERDGGGLYTIPAHTGGREQFIAADGHDPRYSPDGRSIAYWKASQTWHCDPAHDRAFIVPSGGGESKPVAPQLGGTCWPVWAPDSQHVLVAAQPRPDGDLRWLVVPTSEGTSVDTGFSESLDLQNFFCLPRQRAWVGSVIVFDGWWRARPMNMWAATLASNSWRIVPPTQPLTTSTEEQSGASLAADGRLFFSSYSHRLSLWTLAAQPNQGVVLGSPKRVTSGVHLDRLPTASRDGTAVVVARYLEEQEHAIYVVNPQTGRETLRVGRGAAMYPTLSADGSKLAYLRENAIEVLESGHTEPERVSSESGMVLPEGWSHDDGNLLYVSWVDGDARIFELNLKSGDKRLLAADSGHGLYQGRFSPDDRWLSFVDDHEQRQGIWVARIPTSGPIARDTWIAIADATSYNDKPRWSPDGQVLYFLSDRDGFLCIWARRLSPESRKPIGAAFPVYHLHDMRTSMTNAARWFLGFDVARDRLIFNMGERTGNIWSTTLDAQR